MTLYASVGRSCVPTCGEDEGSYNMLVALNIDSKTGALAPVTVPPPLVGNPIFFWAIPSSGSAVFTSNGISSAGETMAVLGFNVGSSGELILNSTFGSPFTQLEIDPAGKYLYQVFGFQSNALIQTLAVDGLGNISLANDFQSGRALAFLGVTLDSTGRFLYAVDQTSGGIAAYAVGDGGPPVPVPGSPFLGLPPLSSFGGTITTDVLGRFLLVPMDGSGIYVFRIDPKSGALTFANSTPVALSDIGGWGREIAVVPGTNLVLILSGDSAIAQLLAYTIDLNTGALSSLGTAVSVQRPPDTLATFTVDPSGKFVYLANADQLLTFSIDPQTGAATQVGPPLIAPAIASLPTTWNSIAVRGVPKQ